MKDTTKKSKPNKQLDGGKILLVATAIVQGVQYAQAFLLVHTALGKFALAGGVLAGGVVVGAIAYAGNNLPRVKAKAAKRWGTVFFIGTLVLSPFVLTPINWHGMDAGLRAEIGWYAWVLAGLVASLPELALGLVALVDRSLISLPAKSSDADSDAQRNPATLNLAASETQRRSATLPAKSSDAWGRSATVPATMYRCECGFTHENRYKFSGHQGKCAIHKQAAMGSVLPAEWPVAKPEKAVKS